LASGLGCFHELPKKKEKGDQLLVDCTGLVPVTVRAVEQIVKVNDVQALEKKLKPIFGVTGQAPKREDADPKNVLVFFIGGVTVAEVAAIRHLGRDIMGDQVRFMIGATNSLNSKKFLNELTKGLFST
jgi:hypothetical protein